MASKRILVIHPDIYAFGGAELVCARAIAALQCGAEISLVHVGGALDPERIKRWSATELDPRKVNFITAGRLGRWIAKLPRFALLKYAIAVRYASAIARDYAIVFSTYAECSIVHPCALQYIHVPMFSSNPEILRYMGVNLPTRYSFLPRLGYLMLCKVVMRWNVSAVRASGTIANSEWTSSIFQNTYGKSHNIFIIYPPVKTKINPSDPCWIEFESREASFVMLGRIHPAKRIEQGVQIIEELRQRGHDVNLHIVGISRDGYAKRLLRRIGDLPFVKVHLNLDRDTVERLIVKQRYGLHCTKYEHFGLAAAEMQSLGCIAFVPDYSGQREVVRTAVQRYTDVADAVLKIEMVLQSPAVQRDLLESSRNMKDVLSVSRFTKGIQEAVKCIEQRARDGAFQKAESI